MASADSSAAQLGRRAKPVLVSFFFFFLFFLFLLSPWPPIFFWARTEIRPREEMDQKKKKLKVQVGHQLDPWTGNQSGGYVLRAKGNTQGQGVFSGDTCRFGGLLQSSRTISRVHCLVTHEVVTDEMYFPSSKGNIRDISRAIFIAALDCDFQLE